MGWVGSSRARLQLLLVCPSPVGRVSLLELVNQLKKGGILIVGDVILPTCSAAPDLPADIYAWRARLSQWQSLVQQAKLKAFVSILSSPSLR